MTPEQEAQLAKMSEACHKGSEEVLKTLDEVKSPMLYHTYFLLLESFIDTAMDAALKELNRLAKRN